MLSLLSVCLWRGSVVAVLRFCGVRGKVLWWLWLDSLFLCSSPVCTSSVGFKLCRGRRYVASVVYGSVTL